MVSLHREKFVVLHLYPTFSVAPLNFSLGANLYPKLPFFTILGAVNPQSHNDEIWRKGAEPGLPSSSQIL